MRGRAHRVQIRDDVVIGIADAKVRGDGIVDHRAKGILKAVGGTDLELLIEQEVGRGINRNRRVEGRLDHCKRLELQVRVQIKDISAGQKIMRYRRVGFWAVKIKVF